MTIGYFWPAVRLTEPVTEPFADCASITVVFPDRDGQRFVPMQGRPELCLTGELRLQLAGPLHREVILGHSWRRCRWPREVRHAVNASHDGVGQVGAAVVGRTEPSAGADASAGRAEEGEEAGGNLWRIEDPVGV